MEYYFSKSKLGFYISELKDLYESANSWPDDAVQITEWDYLKYKSSPPPGKKLSGNSNGLPFWTVSDKPTKDQIDSQVKSKIQNTLSLIKPLEFARDLGDITEQELEDLKNLQKYVVLLNRVKLQEGYPEKIEWPELVKT